jgi:membrane-associated phospholipid phosphatase
MRKICDFILHSRLENVMAAGVSLSLVILFLTTSLFHSFEIGPLDFVFIMLPMGVLGIKAFLGLLTSGNEESSEADPVKYLAAYFRPLLKIVRDWFPFLLLCACYYALYNNLLSRANVHTADASLAKIDAAIFGNQPSFLLEPYIRPWLTDFLNAVYFSHLLYFPGAALYFYLARKDKAFRRLMMGYLTLFLMGVASYVIVPAIGPERFFADRYAHDLHGQMISRGVDYIIGVGRVAYDCFPSLHVGIPLLLALYVRDYQRKLFLPAILYVVVMGFATIYLRYHYFADVAAAFIYAPAAYFLNDLLLRHWPGEKTSRVAAEIEVKRPSPRGEQIAS